MSQDNHETKRDRIRTGEVSEKGEIPRYADPEIREFGIRVKEQYRKHGFTMQELHSKVVNEKKVGIDSLEVFTKILNGRRDRRWKEVFSAIADIFAEEDLRLKGLDHGGASITALVTHYRHLIFGDGVSSPRLVSDGVSEQAPSFERLMLPVEPTLMADRFLDAMPPTLSDIASGFDILRTVFIERNGVRETVLGALSQLSKPCLVSMSGPSGAGKTVLATRLAYECLQREVQVFKLLPDWMCSESIGIQIRRLLESGRPSLFLLDRAGSLLQKGVKPLDIFRTLDGVKTSCVLMFIENWRLFSPYESILGPSSVSESKHFSVFPLTTTELRALLDRLIELETSGRVKEVRCHLSKETRFALCSEDRDRLVAAALLMFRYGRRIADILTEEFNAIDDAALRYAYLSIVVCSGVGLSLPKTIIRKMQKDQGLPQRGDFWKRLAELTSEEDGAISLRHPRFYQHIAPTVIPNPDDRGDLLTDAILHADHDENDELNFVLDVFGHRKQITYLLRRDKSAIERWKSNTKRQLRLMPTIWRRDGYVCLGQLERDSLHDSDSAAEFFEAAISCDPTFRFAYRQRSWNLLRAGRLKDAQQSANQAVDLFPGDAKTLVDSACVLQYCSQEGFRRAGQLFATALTIESGDTDLRHELLRRLDRYREAEAVFKYYILTDDDLPDQILEELKAPWYLWRVRKGIQRALKGELGSLLRYADVDADKVEDVVLSVGKGRDEVLDALVKANTARLEYQQWYHGGKQIDLVAVEKLFVKALERLEARHGESEPFVRTWYGTFLKEVKQDYAAAERQYRLAIKHADQIPGPKKDYPIRNEPMLLNNLALLLMHAARTGKNRASVFKEAEILLNTATGEVTKRQSNFLWPFDTAEELRLLRAEAR